MPAVIPIAVMAAGAIAQKVAQRNAAKKQKKAQETINSRNIGVGDKALGYVDEDRSMYKGMLGDVNSGKFDFNPSTTPARMNASNDFYKEAMGTGLYSEADKNDWRNRQALGNTATFDAVRRGINENASVRGGGYSGYNNQLAKLSRDQARELEAGRLGAETTLQQGIRSNRFRGGEGVQANDSDYTAQLRGNTDIENQYGAMNANNRFGRGAGLLGAMSGATQGYLGTAGQNYRVNAPEEVQPWYGAVGAGAQAAAGAYMGAQTSDPNANKRQKVQNMPTSKYRFNEV